MPLARRTPKRGFNNIFAKPYEIINLSALDKFEDGETVTAEALLAKGILSKCAYGYKVLGNGSVTKKVTVQAAAFSQSAKEAIAAAGGSGLSDSDDPQGLGRSRTAQEDRVHAADPSDLPHR